ncbi:helix-turn-helix transcriptional regulator [Arthrobacter psychrochitiniphilus]|uniref:helix-turn-helix transcriptional regulator n=1 Tax=Arthrobacter psychrochitiniphilus TaxID=291045 RepID=UPI003F7C8030
MTDEEDGVQGFLLPDKRPELVRRSLGSGERHRWVTSLRAELIKEIIEQIRAPGLLGAAVLGPRGSCKTTLAINIGQRLAETHHVVRLHATEAQNSEPFSYFALQVAMLPDYAEEPSEKVVHALVDVITRNAGGDPTLIIVDGLPVIDMWSTAVLMRLLLGGSTKILVVAENLVDMPEDLKWLLKDRRLAQHRLGLLSRAECSDLLEQVLEAPVSGTAVAILLRICAGNLLVLQALVNDYMQQKVLRQHDGIWMLSEPLELGPQSTLGDLVESWVAPESQEVRRALEMVALLQEVSLSMATMMFGADLLALMEEEGFLTFLPQRREVISFVDPYMALGIRSNLSKGTKAARLAELTANVTIDPRSMSSRAVLALAEWLEAAGLPNEPELLFLAGQAALEHFEPEKALAYCALMPHDHALSRTVPQVRSRAYLLLGDFARALEILQEHEAATVQELEAGSFAVWTADMAKALMWLPDGYSRVTGLLNRAAAKIELLAPGGCEAAEAYLKLARYENEVHHGNVSRVSSELEKGRDQGVHSEYALNCASLLTMVLATTGHESEAVQLSRDIPAKAERQQITLSMADWRIRARIFALGWSGQWKECEAELEGIERASQGSTLLYGSNIELMRGIIYLQAGQSSLAVPILRKSLAQLEVWNFWHSRALAYSALALACAEVDEPGQSKKYLAMAHAEEAETDWFGRSLAECFQLQTQAMAKDPRALPAIVQRAEMDLEIGRYTTAAGFAFAAVVQGGSAEHYELLERASQKCQGPLASSRTLLAKARRIHSPQLALEAANMAHQLGLPALELLSSQEALAMAQGRTKEHLQLARNARQRVNVLLPNHSDSKHRPASSLTPRETQVAQFAVQGKSNRQIAEELEVSVRTVEGHLYQVFAKLNIISRAELERGILREPAWIIR